MYPSLSWNRNAVLLISNAIQTKGDPWGGTASRRTCVRRLHLDWCTAPSVTEVLYAPSFSAGLTLVNQNVVGRGEARHTLRLRQVQLQHPTDTTASRLRIYEARRGAR